MIKSNRIVKTGIVICLIFHQFLHCIQSFSGINVVGNPQRITAIIKKANGVPAAGISVSIVPTGYNPIKDSISANNRVIFTDTTDENGFVELKSIDTGYYNLISNEEDYRCSLYVKNIAVHDSLVNLNSVYFKKPGQVIVKIDSIQFEKGGAFIIPGTSIVYPVTEPGELTIPVPAGNIELLYVKNTGDSVSGGPVIKKEISEGETFNLNSEIIYVPVTYYDFHSDRSNPEFESPHTEGIRLNMVASLLDTEGKPVLGMMPYINNYMKYWFRAWNDSSRGDFTKPMYTFTGDMTNAYATYNGPVNIDYDTAFKNIVILDSLSFTPVGNGIYQFSSHNFHPLDKTGFGAEGKDHNFSFTMEMSIPFLKNPGQNITVTSKEMWLFVNNTLYLDNGGIKPATTVTLNFDSIPEVKLPNGNETTLKLFFAERSSSQSALTIQTNILKKQ